MAKAKLETDYKDLSMRLYKRIADLEKENTELKKKCYKKAVKDYCELEKENAELKSGCGMCYRKDKEQLTKSTEIIKKLYAVYYDPCVTESDLKYRDDLFAEIKQFLSEVENV